jgi:dTDP-glucose 4,6-dehydratase
MANFWKDKKVLVTGAAGFIGSHLVETLLKEGASVTAFIRYTSTGSIGMLEEIPIDKLEKVELYFGDLRDPYAVREALKGKDTVFHLGAVISVPYSYIHPREVIEVNVLGTLNILEASREFKIPNIVVVSTSEVFGTALYTPIDENHPRRGQSPYAASKISADEISRSFHLTYELPVKIIRPFNTFGPRQSQRAVISTIIVQALKGEEVKLGNLESVRDFTYVSDTVKGILLCGEKEDAIGRDINLGTGRGYRIRDVAERIFRILGTDKKIIVERERLRPEDSEVEKLIASNALASSLLGWKPEVDLDEGLRLTIDWIKDHIDFYRREIP